MAWRSTPSNFSTTFKKYGELPVTSAISTEDFVKAFEGQDEIIYISISSKLSECYQNATEAVRQLGAGRTGST